MLEASLVTHAEQTHMRIMIIMIIMDTTGDTGEHQRYLRTHVNIVNRLNRTTKLLLAMRWLPKHLAAFGQELRSVYFLEPLRELQQQQTQILRSSAVFGEHVRSPGIDLCFWIF